MKKREWLSLLVLALTAVAAILIGIKTISITGVDGMRLMRPETKQLLAEITILFAAAGGILCLVKDGRIRFGLLTVEAAIFTWIHQAFLPMVVSGIYLIVIIGLGRKIRKILDPDQRFASQSSATKMADLTLGAVALILLYCLMSLAGIGSIGAVRIAAAAIGAWVCIPAVSKLDRSMIEHWKERKPESIGIALLWAFIFTMILLQVGSMNICADYDSLHYGLRSEYVLNDGG